jgi:cellulose synthase/poly-beta-1,6-N-acetylglucosamine synthase-like glycosyltransferase
MNLAYWAVGASSPTWVVALFWVAWILVITAFVQVVSLGVAGWFHSRHVRRRHSHTRWSKHAPDAHAATSNDADDYLWVFLVPALNEEVTIRDSVSRLAQVDVAHKIMLVIDDGSDDATGEILAGLDAPGLRVLTRHAPYARVGKAAALNAAYFHLLRDILAESEYAGFTPDNTIVGVVDADGRVDAHAPQVLARRFADPDVGGAQLLVRIYNRMHLLARAQDLEFGIFGHIVQAGRSLWGSANMGGNGQFNRLAALESIATERGPWRDKLTEDQDLGVRLVQQGWRSVQENRASVNQQGLSSLRRLHKQRTRWAQGAWQAIGLSGHVGRMPHAPHARLDALVYLLTPMLQLVVGADLVFDLVYALATHSDPLPTGFLLVLLVLAPSVASMLPAAIVVARRRGGLIGLPWGVLIGFFVYPLYNWLLMPSLFHALVRQLSGATSWAKTAREAIAV